MPFPPVQTVTGRISVFHGTNFLVPPTGRTPAIVTIHDLAALRLPGSVPTEVARRFRTSVEVAAQRAARVVVDSQCGAADVEELLGIARDRIRVVPLGVTETFALPGNPLAEDELLRVRYGVQRPYLLFVGTSNPRKNVVRLLEAFAKAREREGLEHRLVLAGDPGFAAGDVGRRIDELSLRDAVVATSYVAEPDLAPLYRRADALALASSYEGFGLPVLEAMAAGTPVLAADAASLPEVAGDAALLVDPLSSDAMTDGVVAILTDLALRERLIPAGRERARGFTWKACAQAYLALYRELAS